MNKINLRHPIWPDTDSNSDNKLHIRNQVKILTVCEESSWDFVNESLSVEVGDDKIVVTDELVLRFKLLVKLSIIDDILFQTTENIDESVLDVDDKDNGDDDDSIWVLINELKKLSNISKSSSSFDGKGLSHNIEYPKRLVILRK